MKQGFAFAAAAALLLAAPLLAEDSVAWQRLHADDEGVYAFDPASVRRTGEMVRVTLRLEPAERGGIVYIADFGFDCAGASSTLFAGREIGPGGEELRAVTVPADRTRPEPIDAASGMAPLFRNFCPGAALPERPAGPAIVATPPGSESRSCPRAEGAPRCGEADPDR